LNLHQVDFIIFCARSVAKCLDTMKVTVAALLVLVAFAVNAIAEPVPAQQWQAGNPLEQPGQWNGGNPQQPEQQWNGGSQLDNQGQPATGIVDNVFGMLSGFFRGIGNMVSGIIQSASHHNPHNNGAGNNNPAGVSTPGAVSAVSSPQGQSQPLFNAPIATIPSQLQAPPTIQPQPIGTGPIPLPVQPIVPSPGTVGPAPVAGQPIV